MPFQYRPFVNPYISSMSDLMGRGVEARSRAALTAADVQAGAQRRLGDITGAQWRGLGDTVAGGIDAYVTEQREAPLREHALWKMEQDKVAAERATVEAKRGDETYLLKQEELKDSNTYDTIMSEGELELAANPGNKDAVRADVRVKIAQAGLSASHMNDYEEMLRAADIHASAILRDQAEIEAANARGASAAAILKQSETRQEKFEEIKRTRNEFGDNSPENRAARGDYFLFTGEEDPVLGRKHELTLANIRASSGSRRPEIASAIDNYTGAIRDFAQTGNRAPMHQAEQLLWHLGENPGNVRANIVEGLDKEQREIYKDLNPAHFGEREGTPPESLFPSLPEVSTFGSVYAPPPPLDPRSVEGAITERELAAEVEKAPGYGLGSLEEAAASYRARGIDVVENDGSPSWLGLNQPPPRTTDIPLSASSQAIIPAAETAAQRAQQMRSNVPFGEELRGAVGSVTSTVGSLLRGTPGRRETSSAISRIPYTAKDHGGLKGLVDYVVNNQAEFEDDNPAVDVEDYLEAIQRKIIVAEMPRQSPGKRPR